MAPHLAARKTRLPEESTAADPQHPPGDRVRRARAARRTPDQPCLNCGDPTPGNYCPQCGQPKRQVRVSVRVMALDVIEDQLALNRALPGTLSGLLLRPGFLTNEYIAGRIVRFIPPFRLYLVASVVFFLLLSFFGLRALERVDIDTGSPENARLEAARIAAAEVETLGQIDTTALSPEARQSLAEATAAFVRASAALGGDTLSAAGLGTMPRGMLQPWARNITINTGSSRRDSLLKSRILDRYGHLPIDQALREFAPAYVEYLPHMVFLMLPLFAFMLKLLYIRRNRYYAEHFVFSLHVHAFIFLMFILMLLIRHEYFILAASLWILVYLWLAMKRVYRQGWFRTTVKAWVLGWSYFIVLNIGLVAMIFVALLV